MTIHSTDQFLDTKFDEYSFLFAHCYCVFAHIVTTLCYKCNQHEIGKFFDISKVPVYFYFIFRAHYYELNMITHTDGFDLSCGDGRFNLYELWLLLELRIFYGYILTGIFFLLMSSFFGIDKKLKKDEEMLTRKGGDFLESYRSAQLDFSLQSFELFVTIIVFIESRPRNHDATNNLNHGTYLAAIILCLLYAMVTVSHSFGMFFLKTRSYPWGGFAGQMCVSLLRFFLLSASLACLFT